MKIKRSLKIIVEVSSSNSTGAATVKDYYIRNDINNKEIIAFVEHIKNCADFELKRKYAKI